MRKLNGKILTAAIKATRTAENSSLATMTSGDLPFIEKTTLKLIEAAAIQITGKRISIIKVTMYMPENRPHSLD